MLKFVVLKIGTLIKPATGFCTLLSSDGSAAAVVLLGDARVWLDSFCA